LASILNSTVPIFVLLYSWALLSDEQPSPLKIGGVISGFLGVVVIFAPTLVGQSMGGRTVYGMLAVIGMAAAYGLGAVLMKRWGHSSVDSRWNLILQGICGSMLLIVASFATEGTAWTGSFFGHPKAILAVLYLAIFSTAIAWLLFFKLIRVWGT